MHADEGLLALPRTAATSMLPKPVVAAWRAPLERREQTAFDVKIWVARFADCLCRDSEVQLDQAQLRGDFNPFSRRAKVFPPLRVGLHVAADPRSLLDFMSEARQYDEEQRRSAGGGAGGRYVNRADALRTPGTATVPFDPNDLPVPMVECPVSWWTGLPSKWVSGAKAK